MGTKFSWWEIAVVLGVTVLFLMPYSLDKRYPPERPVVNLPEDMRQRNWRDTDKSGSCTWASMVSLLRWQGQYELADYIRQTRAGGESMNGWSAKLDEAHVRHIVIETRGDVEFL